MPDPRLEEAIKEAYASAPTSRVIFHTLEFLHPNFVNQFNAPASIRVVQGNNTLNAQLEAGAPLNPGEYVDFLPVAFDFEPPNVENVARPELTITIDNVDRQIEDNLILATNTPYPVTVIYRPYLDNDLTKPQTNPPLEMMIVSADADDFRVTARAAFGNAANKSCPYDIYTISRFPGLRRT